MVHDRVVRIIAVREIVDALSGNVIVPAGTHGTIVRNEREYVVVQWDNAVKSIAYSNEYAEVEES